MKYLTIALLAALTLAGCDDTDTTPAAPAAPAATQHGESEIARGLRETKLEKPKVDDCKEGYFICAERRATEAIEAKRAAEAQGADAAKPAGQ